MNIERANHLIEILSAFKQGKTIQRELNDGWQDITTLTGEDLKQATILIDKKYLELRVKPESTYIPFEMEDAKLFRDKWYRAKNGTSLGRINSFSQIEKYSCYINGIRNSEFLEYYTFEDGTPCGKLITE